MEVMLTITESESGTKRSNLSHLQPERSDHNRRSTSLRAIMNGTNFIEYSHGRNLSKHEEGSFGSNRLARTKDLRKGRDYHFGCAASQARTFGRAASKSRS